MTRNRVPEASDPPALLVLLKSWKSSKATLSVTVSACSYGCPSWSSARYYDTSAKLSRANSGIATHSSYLQKWCTGYGERLARRLAAMCGKARSLQTIKAFSIAACDRVGTRDSGKSTQTGVLKTGSRRPGPTSYRRARNSSYG